MTGRGRGGGVGVAAAIPSRPVKDGRVAIGASIAGSKGAARRVGVTTGAGSLIGAKRARGGAGPRSEGQVRPFRLGLSVRFRSARPRRPSDWLVARRPEKLGRRPLRLTG